MTALLNYGQVANEYFNYADMVEDYYSVPHTEDYKAELSTDELTVLNSGAVANITQQGSATIRGVSYITKMKPEFRFYFNSGSYCAASVDGGLNASTAMENGVLVVKVTGLKPNEFDKTFNLQVGDTAIEFNGYAYIKSALANPKTKYLAIALFRYSQAYMHTFG